MTDSSGVTLVELMIAAAVLSVAVIGLIGAFSGIQRAIQTAKLKTLAANLAQEQMQILTQKNYYEVVATQSPVTTTGANPNFQYDNTVFPPTTITEGGVSFIRYTYVQVVQEINGALVVQDPTTPDTGLRLLTVTVTWTANGTAQQMLMSSIMANPNTVMNDSIIRGRVTDKNTGQPIIGALVDIAENQGWRDTTRTGGSYLITLFPGGYEMTISAPGYYTAYAAVAPIALETLTTSFALVEISTGYVSGTVWIDTNVVVSQVVASTVQADTGFDAEYIELFNPTWSTITMNNGTVNLNVTSGDGLSCTNIPLTYNATTINPQHYFIIANTTTFYVNGSSYNATGTPAKVDAYYNPASANPGCNSAPAGWSPPTALPLIQRNQSDTIYLTDSGGNIIDAVGWTLGAASPTLCSGGTGTNCIFQAAGLQAGEQVVRTSSPSYASSRFGRAYNSGDNQLDFAYPGNAYGTAANSLATTQIQYSPFSSNQKVSFDTFLSSAPNSLSASQLSTYTIAGIPAYRAVVSANDGYSSPTHSTNGTAFPPPQSTYGFPISTFTLANVSTGTWITIISSASYMLEYDTVTLSVAGSTFTFASSTTILNSADTQGYITGTVTDIDGIAISGPAIQVSPGNAGATATCSTTKGTYTLRVSTGFIDVTANPNNANPSYVTMTSAAVSVSLGSITSGVNFQLTQGGVISGYVTRDGTNPLPGIAVAALDADGNSHDQEVTGVTGYFTTINLATGTYNITPELDTLQSSSPTATSVVAVAGTNMFSSTFTISNALGTIAGSVTLSGKPLTTGVLIIMSTSALSGSPPSPPSISTATLTGASYYMGSSNENGTYSIAVRTGSYHIYGWYPEVTPTGTVTLIQRQSGQTVNAGASAAGPTLAW